MVIVLAGTLVIEFISLSENGYITLDLDVREIKVQYVCMASNIRKLIEYLIWIKLHNILSNYIM